MRLIESLNILILKKIQKKNSCILPKNRVNKQLLEYLLNLNYLISFRDNNWTYLVNINYNNNSKIKIIYKLSQKKIIKYFFLKKYYSFFYQNKFLILTSYGLLSVSQAVSLRVGGFIIAHLY